MDNYEKLLKEINLFLQENEVENSEDVISLYELYNVMNKEFIHLKKLDKIDQTFREKLNSFKSLLFGRRDAFFVKNFYCIDILADEKLSKITFSNSDCEDSDAFYKISVIKDKNNRDVYLDKKIDNSNKYIYKFIVKNFEFILDTLCKIEKYYELIGKVSNDENHIINFEGDNNFLYYKISYDKTGWINLYTNVSSKHPLYEEVNKTYLSKQSIHKYLKEKNVDILKRIPININELPIDILNIYEEGKDYIRDKEFVKTIKWWN